MKSNILHDQPSLSLRKSITILFLLIFFTSHIGYYCFYAFQQYQVKAAVKRQIHAGIPDSSLEMIVAEENNSFRWEEEGKEFSQHGQLYDVVKTVIKNGKTILYCINDVREKELLHNFCKTLKSGNNKKARQTLKIQISDFVVDSLETGIRIKQTFSKKYFCFNTDIVFCSKEINTPPPRS